MPRTKSLIVLSLAASSCGVALAQSAEELAKKLSNPVAELISVPLQFNYDEHYGAAQRGRKSFINVQPVVPITLNAEWNVISRTILPVVIESTYDLKAEKWSVPINVTATKLLKLGGQAMSVGGGVRYWADSPQSGPHDWGLRLIVTFLFLT